MTDSTLASVTDSTLASGTDSTLASGTAPEMNRDISRVKWLFIQYFHLS